MADNGTIRLKTNLSMIGDILKFQMKQKINAHGYCTLEGIIADGYQDNFVKENNSKKIVEIYLENILENNNKKIIFAGVIEKLSVYHDGNVYFFKISLYSATFLMDLEKKNRSFQDKHMTYGKLLRKIVSSYEGGDIIDHLSDGKEIEELFVQYQETDWEFLKRLASHFHGSILAASEFASPKIFFGATKERSIGKLEQFSYSMEKQLFRYHDFIENEDFEFCETDCLQIKMQDYNYYEPGSCVSWKNFKLFIGEIEANLNQGELIFQYTLCTEKGLGQAKIYAENLSGISLCAEVLEVVRDKIKVKLEIDDYQDINTAWEFPYQTMYTAQGEGGWYCMPEKGDLVMIYFPNKKESSAMGSSSVRKSGVAAKKVSQPEIKFFRTIYGKEIRFTPSSVEIICEDQKTGKKQAQITLHEDNGIEIYSNGKITFASGEGITIDAGEELEIAASKQIRLRCKKGRIQMDDMIEIAGPDVRMN